MLKRSSSLMPMRASSPGTSGAGSNIVGTLSNIRDETYAGALASIIDHYHAHRFITLWGPGDTSSSDRQLFRASWSKPNAGQSQRPLWQRAGRAVLHPHLRPLRALHSKVIAVNAGEAPHVIDELLDHESGIAIREHATDTAGAVDHVFGLCHLLGFRFAPRIRDFGERRL